jgi:16S rRNA (guanine1207-N2)-methyltransferase
MTNHYYNNNLDTKSDVKQFTFKLLSNELKFLTDHGVFSKGTIDYGTRVLIENCEVLPSQKKFLDLGCGYGPVGISLAKEFSHIEVDMVDVNLRALELAKKNANLNKLTNVNIFMSNIYQNIRSTYDCILTNPPIRAGKSVVFEMLEKSYEYLNDDGVLYVVIQKKQGAPSAKENLMSVFENCEIVSKDKGYYILKSVKK